MHIPGISQFVADPFFFCHAMSKTHTAVLVPAGTAEIRYSYVRIQGAAGIEEVVRKSILQASVDVDGN